MRLPDAKQTLGPRRLIHGFLVGTEAARMRVRSKQSKHSKQSKQS